MTFSAITPPLKLSLAMAFMILEALTIAFVGTVKGWSVCNLSKVIVVVVVVVFYLFFFLS